MPETFLTTISHSNYTQNSDLTPVQVQMDGLVSTFVERAMDGYALAGIVSGGIVNSGVKGSLLHLARPFVRIAPTVFSSFAKGGALIAGLIAEGTVFHGVPQALKVLAGGDLSLIHLYGAMGLKEGALHAITSLAGIKIAGVATAPLHPIIQNFAQASSMVVSNHAATFFGIGDKPRESIAHQLTEAEGVVLHLWVGMRLLHELTPTFTQWVGAKDLGIKSIDRGVHLWKESTKQLAWDGIPSKNDKFETAASPAGISELFGRPVLMSSENKTPKQIQIGNQTSNNNEKTNIHSEGSHSLLQSLDHPEPEIRGKAIWELYRAKPKDSNIDEIIRDKISNPDWWPKRDKERISDIIIHFPVLDIDLLECLLKLPKNLLENMLHPLGIRFEFMSDLSDGEEINKFAERVISSPDYLLRFVRFFLHLPQDQMTREFRDYYPLFKAIERFDDTNRSRTLETITESLNDQEYGQFLYLVQEFDLLPYGKGTDFLRSAYRLKHRTIASATIKERKRLFKSFADSGNFEQTLWYIKHRRRGDPAHQLRYENARSFLMGNIAMTRSDFTVDKLRSYAKEQGMELEAFIQSQLPAALYGLKEILKTDRIDLGDNFAYISLDRLLVGSNQRAVSPTKVRKYEKDLKKGAPFPGILASVLPNNPCFFCSNGYHRSAATYLSGADYIKAKLLYPNPLEQEWIQQFIPASVAYLIMSEYEYQKVINEGLPKLRL
jgi:hypothetical protein